MPEPLFLPRYRGMISDTDALLRSFEAASKDHDVCLRALYATGGAETLIKARAMLAQSYRDLWRPMRSLLIADPKMTATRGIKMVTQFSNDVLRDLVRIESEQNACIIEKSGYPKAPLRTFDVAGADDWIGDDELGADAPTPLEIQTGIWHGQAVAYCPQTGHMAIEPLRAQAAKLVRAGHLPEGLSGELIDGLESLHIGDDLILEMGDDVIGDDVIEVGRGKIAKKIKGGIKKAAKKTVKAAKKVAKSKLGKVLKAAVSIANPAAGVSISALSKAGSIAKKAKNAAKAKKSGKKPAASDQKAAKTLSLAMAVNQGKSSKKKAGKKAKQAKIPKSDVKATNDALTTIDAAQAGDPVAQSAVATNTQIDTATETQLEPSLFQDDGGGGSPADFAEEDDGSAPEVESTEPYFEEGEEGEAPEIEQSDEGEIEEDEGDEGDEDEE